jgi:hypothetical protein
MEERDDLKLRLLFPHPIHCTRQNEMNAVEADVGRNQFIRYDALLQSCVEYRHCSLTIPSIVHVIQTALCDAL